MKKRVILSILLVLMLVFSSAAAYAEGHDEDMDMEPVETEDEAVAEEEVVEEEVTEEETTEEVTEEVVEMEEVMEAAASVQLTIDVEAALVDGEAVALEVAPFISEGRTMVPLAFISNQLGAEVEWNGEARSVTYTKGDTVIVLVIDSTIAMVNGEEVQLDVAPMIHADRTVVPVNFISTMLGYDVEWNGETRTVTITQAMEEEAVEEEVVEEEVEEEIVEEEVVDEESTDDEATDETDDEASEEDTEGTDEV